MYDKHREDAHTGELATGHGSLRFAEDYYGEFFYFDMYDSTLQENKRVALSAAEIYAIAKAGVLSGVFDSRSLDADVEETKQVARRREEELEHIRSIYEGSMTPSLAADYDAAHAYLGGGDESIDTYHAVEGWGIHQLGNGDFEVTYKV